MDKKWIEVAGGGDSREPTRTPDSLLSQDYFEVLLALSEGPIKGLVSANNTLENFYAGDTPAFNLATGQANFSDFTATLYAGTSQDSDITLQLGGAASNVGINVALSYNTPVVRQTPGIQRGLFDTIEIRLRFDYMVKTTDSGTFDTAAYFRIEYKLANTSVWQYANPDDPGSGSSSSQIIVRGKTTSGYARDFTIYVPLGATADYDIRVTKLSPDGVQGVDADVVQMTWESYQLVKRGKVKYPYLALMHLYGRASNQFTSLPEFSGVYDGLVVRVPTNYNPATRVYDETVPWNGTFKNAYTNNGVWILYELLTNERWGLARYYKGVTANRYEFYEEAKWCDQMVPDGRGGQQPRFTYNDWITEARNGPDLLKYIAGSFNAILDDDGNGYVTIRSDRPRAATQVFTPQNVTPAGFSYTFTDVSSRHNDIRVAFINPDLDWEEDWRSATIDNTADIAQNGRVPFEFVAVGCTDANEAVRRANYRYVTANKEITTVSFVTSRVGLLCNLMDTIYVADPLADWGNAARVKSATATQIQLRDPMWFPDLLSRTIKVQTYSGLFVTQVTPAVVGDNYTLNVTAGNFPVSNVPPNTVFTVEDMAGIGLSKPFRVIGVGEVDGKPDEVEITAHEVADGKYEQVEATASYTASKYAFATPGEPTLPANITLFAPQPVVNTDGSLTFWLEASWKRPPDAFTEYYEIDFRHILGGPWVTIQSRGERATLAPVVPGEGYLVRLFAVSPLGRRSQKYVQSLITAASRYGTVENVQGLNVVRTNTGWDIQWSAYADIPDFSHVDIRVGTVSTTDFDSLPEKYRAAGRNQPMPWLTAGTHRVMAKYRNRSGNASTTAAVFDLTITVPATPILEVNRGLDNTLLRFQDCTTTQPIKDVLVRMGTNTSTWDTATATAGGGANQRSVTVIPSAVNITKVYVRVRDVADNLSNIATETIPPAAGDVQALLNLVNTGITRDALAPSLLATIDLITAPATTVGSVAAQVEAERVARVQAINDEVTNRNSAIATAKQEVTTAFQTADTSTLSLAKAYTYSKSEADSAIAQQINTYNAALTGPSGAISSAVSTESLARATADGYLGAQWTVKVGLAVSGQPAEIAGIAIAGTSAGTAGARFDMAFRANAFYFLPPSGQSNSLYQPLVYYATPQTINGVQVPAGLYLKSAFIEYIKADQIDTRGITVKDNSGNILFGSGQNLDWSRINASTGWLNNQDGTIRTPGGGVYVTQSPTVFGSLKIRTPNWFTDTMLSMFVDVYEYATGFSCTMQLSGYTLVSGGWYNVSATVIGASNVEYPVYFGHDGTKACIWIGDKNTDWSYPQVRVRDVLVGYVNYNKELWESGWQISFDTAWTGQPGSTANKFNASVLDTYPGADWSKTTRKPANVAALTGSEAIRNDLIAIPKGTMNADPGCEKASAWLLDPGVTLSTTNAQDAVGRGIIVFSGANTNQVAFSAETIPVNPQKRYRLTARLAAQSGNNRNMYITVRMFRADNIELGGPETGWGGTYAGYVFGTTVPADSQLREYGDDFGAGTSRQIPSNVSYVRVGVWANYSNSGSSTGIAQYAQDIRLVEVTDVRAAQSAATTAQQTATAAQQTADAANTAIAAIVSDSVLSRGEKPQVIRDYEVLYLERTDIVAKANLYAITTELNNYLNAFDALGTYLGGLSPAWNDTSQNTNIVAATFQLRWSDAYYRRQLVLNRISEVALSKINTAQDAAVTAAQNAQNAQISANAANDALAAIANDNVLTKGEKPRVILDWTAIANEQAGIEARALAYSIGTETTNYTNAIGALSAYLSSLSPGWNTLTADTPIDGPTFRAKFTDLYTKRQALLNKIAEVAGTKASWSGVSSRPANLAALSGAESINNALVGGNLLWRVTSGSAPPGTYATVLDWLRLSGSDTDAYGLKPGETLTISADLWCDATCLAAGQNATIYLWSNKSDGGWTQAASATVVSTTPGRVSGTMTLPSSLPDMWSIGIGIFHQGTNADTSPAGTVYCDRVQVERGPAATQYKRGAQPGATSGAPAGTLVAGVAAETVRDNASTALTNANNAQNAANAANNAISAISDDNVLSKGEKPMIRTQWLAIDDEKAGILAQASAYGITTEATAYNNAWGALNSYLSSLSPSYADFTTDTNVSGATLRANFVTLYSTRQALLNKIAEVAGTRATWSNVSGPGRPRDNATVGATFGVDINGQINPSNVSTYIANAAIKLAQIDTASITNLSAISAVIGTLRTATSGGRVEIADNVIRVYDDSNQLRVKIGNLTL